MWLAFAIGRWAPTRRDTYGYGRAEDLAGSARRFAAKVTIQATQELE
jgi:Co/Zn/Cd efflux system component